MSIFLLLVASLVTVVSGHDCGGEYVRRDIANSDDYLCVKAPAAKSDEDILKELSMLEEQTEQDDSSSSFPSTPPWTSYLTTNNTEQQTTYFEELTTSYEELTTSFEELTTSYEELTTSYEEPTTSYVYDDTSYFKTETGPTTTESETMFFTTYSGMMSLPTDPDPSLMKQKVENSKCTSASIKSDEDYIWLNCDGLTAVVKLNTESGQPQILCCPVSE